MKLASHKSGPATEHENEGGDANPVTASRKPHPKCCDGLDHSSLYPESPGASESGGQHRQSAPVVQLTISEICSLSPSGRENMLKRSLNELRQNHAEENPVGRP